MQVRIYGSSGPLVAVLHGGPGAPGHMAPVARGLADSFQILEPFQRPSGAQPLTVACHVEDLRQLIASRCAGTRPALVGSSWGAMLALAFAAAHPNLAGPLVLIGCGTFDRAARARFHETITERMSEALLRQLQHLAEEFPDPDQRLKAKSQLLLPLYSHQPITTDLELENYDARSN
jgi:pimeloyl-ACP methyl ester carboxylesterase